MANTSGGPDPCDRRLSDRSGGLATELAGGFPPPDARPPRDIYWMELRAVCLAIDLALRLGARKILVCTDSMIVCDLFQSHSPIPLVRGLFRVLAHLLVDASADVKVAHIPRVRNVFADALSRGKLDEVMLLKPTAVLLPLPHIHNFPDGGFRH